MISATGTFEPHVEPVTPPTAALHPGDGRVRIAGYLAAGSLAAGRLQPVLSDERRSGV
jgi:hypothetical protein